MEKTFCIYKHTCPNGKVYIGQTCQEPNKRFGKDGSRYKGCTLFYNAIQKYGWDNIRHEILYTGLSLDEANQIESEMILLHRSNDRKYGYNLQSGGLNGVPGAETRIKMSAWQQGKVLSEETRRKISEASIGRKDTLETRIKKSKSHMGKKLSPEVIQKLTLAHRDKVDLKSQGRKLGLSNKGRIHSNATRQKLSDALKGKNSKKVKCIETGIVYDSLSDAECKTGVWRQNIGKVCNGVTKTAGGCHWIFIIE